MKEAELLEFLKQDRQRCAEHWHACRTAAELELSARIVFPVGSLPNESDPLSFTQRELEIISRLLHQTSDMENRATHAMLEVALKRQGATFNS